MKYEIKLNGHTYEVEVELAEAMAMQEFQAFRSISLEPGLNNSKKIKFSL